MCVQVIAELGRATTIDFAVYSITNPKIADAIIAAHRAVGSTPRRLQRLLRALRPMSQK